ncbi:acetyl-coenzyme A transporter 1-like isoform X2 [Daktulosphaira vitifoliae]|nr:acetyl-coenzyme A transporter 1-like isoform X2 [Daktulosphaira vitifoliae]
MVYWPYSMKLLLAPLFDATLSKRIGKRKMWIVPVQTLIGVILICIGYKIQSWLTDGQTPQVNMITTMFILLITLSSIQEIVIDGWSLHFLRKENVPYAALCNNCGRAFGIILGYVVLLLLESENFCNRWLRFNDQNGGILSFKGYFYFWGIVFLFSAATIGIFKREIFDGSLINVHFLNIYYIAWKIIQLDTIKRFCLIITTYEIGFAAIDAVSYPKFLEYGIDRDNIVLVDLSMYPIEMFVIYFIAKHTIGPKPMSLFIKIMPYRILTGIFAGMLVFYTPKYVSKNNSSSPYFFMVFELYNIFQKLLTMIMRLSILSFFSRVSDPSAGSTYMSILNTLFSLENSITKTSAYALVGLLTFKHCTRESYIDDQDTSEDCLVIIDGYYIELGLCIVFSISWHLLTKRFIINLQARNIEEWHVNKENQIFEIEK